MVIPPCVHTRYGPVQRSIFAGISIAGALYLFMSLYPFPVASDDAQSHLDWIDQFNKLRSSGVMYPRWLPEARGGFGALTFYAYPPLTYFLGNAYSALLGIVDPVRLYHLLQLTSAALSAIFLAMYLRYHHATRGIAILAGVLYAIGPYRFADVFRRCALSEQMSFIWLPLLLLAIDYALDRRPEYRVRSIVLGSLASAGIVMTNLPMTIIALLMCGCYAGCRAQWHHRAQLWPCVVGMALGMMIASVYILPVLHVLPLMSTRQMLHLTDTQLWIVVNAFRPAEIKVSLHALIPATFATSLLMTPFLVQNLRRPRARTSPLASALLVFIVISFAPQIRWLAGSWWLRLPLISFIQFPWRFAGLLTLAVPVVFVLSSDRRIPGIPRLVAQLSTLLYVCFMVFWYGRYTYQVLHSPAPCSPPRNLGAAEHVPVFACSANGVDENTYVIAHRNSPPAWLTGAIEGVPPNPLDSIRLLTGSPIERTYSATIAGIDTAYFHLYYWPDWKLTEHGRVLPTAPGYHGLMSAYLSPGRHTLIFRLERSDAEKVGTILTLTGIFLLVSLCTFGTLLDSSATSRTRIGDSCVGVE